MSAPSSPSVSSASDDFAALLDAELLTTSSPDELAEHLNAGTEEDEDVDVDGEEEEANEAADEAEGLGLEAGEAGEVLPSGEVREEGDNENEKSKLPSQIGYLMRIPSSFPLQILRPKPRVSTRGVACHSFLQHVWLSGQAPLLPVKANALTSLSRFCRRCDFGPQFH